MILDLYDDIYVRPQQGLVKITGAKSQLHCWLGTGNSIIFMAPAPIELGVAKLLSVVQGYRLLTLGTCSEGYSRSM